MQRRKCEAPQSSWFGNFALLVSVGRWLEVAASQLLGAACALSFSQTIEVCGSIKSDVCCWHLADMTADVGEVRFRGKADIGKWVAIDPKRTSHNNNQSGTSRFADHYITVMFNVLLLTDRGRRLPKPSPAVTIQRYNIYLLDEARARMGR
jgi:hypothetical protein